jgi:hypothetical protein
VLPWLHRQEEVSQEKTGYNIDDIVSIYFDISNSSLDNSISLDIISSLINDDTCTTHLDDSNISYLDSISILFNTSVFNDRISF